MAFLAARVPDYCACDVRLPPEALGSVEPMTLTDHHCKWRMADAVHLFESDDCGLLQINAGSATPDYMTYHATTFPFSFFFLRAACWRYCYRPSERYPPRARAPSSLLDTRVTPPPAAVTSCFCIRLHTSAYVSIRSKIPCPVPSGRR